MKEAWGSVTTTWGNTPQTWGGTETLLEIANQGGGPGGYEPWGTQNQKKTKKAIKLIMQYKELNEERKKEYKNIKIRVRDVDITINELVHRVENIIFIDNK